MNHEFVNLLKIGRRVGQKRIGDIEGLFDNRVTSDDDNCIFLQVFFSAMFNENYFMHLCWLFVSDDRRCPNSDDDF